MNKQSGNALWLILIAIFLLGGLTVLLSRTGSQTEDTGSAEQMQILASEMIRYGADIETGIKTLLGRGCSENQISLWYDSNNDGTENASDSYYNSNSPTDRSCHVFDVNGAGLTYKNVAAKIDPTFVAAFATTTNPMAMKKIGTDTRGDVYMRLMGDAAIMKNFCLAVNRISGIKPTGTAGAGVFDPQFGNIMMMTTSPFTGTFPPDVTTATTSPVEGKKAFCVGNSAAITTFAYAIFPR